MSRRLVNLLVVLWMGACGGGGSSEAPAGPIRLIEAGLSRADWPEPGAPVPESVLPAEIGAVAAPGRLGRVVMHVRDDGRDARVALLAPTGSRHEASFSVPERDPALRLAVGYLLETTAPGLALGFRVLLTPEDGEPVEILGESVTTAADGRWLDREISLAAWAGKRVRLTLATESPAGGPPIWAAFGAPEVFERARQPEGWNVLLVVLDTLRADHLGSYGYSRPTSPHLDALAQRSFRFTTAVSQSSWTRPSHRSLFTGLYPLSQGGLASPALAEVLWAHGYRTQATTGGAQLAYQFGFSRGFEKHEIARWVRSIDDVVATLEANRSRRHFQFLHTYEIHDPYEHRELAAGLDPGRVGEVFRRATLARLRGKLTSGEQDYVTALYDSGILYTDAQLGLLLARLEERRLLDRTLLIVTSDHGEELWDHGHWGHGRAMFDHQSLVPLIVHVPPAMRAALRLSAGPEVIRQQVRLVDLYPTILDLLGIPLEHRVHGRSLRPLLAGGRLPALEAFSESVYWGPVEVKALRGERYKYMRGVPKKPDDPEHERWEALFDLAADPTEKTEVQERNREILARMRLLVDGILRAGGVAEEALPPGLDPEVRAQLRALGYLDP